MQLDNVTTVAKREYLARVKTKAFWISTIILPLFMGAMMILPSYFASKAGARQELAVVDLTGRVAEPLTAALYAVGALAALFHDFGYLRRRNDNRHRYGAEYTLVHVSRGAGFLRRYVRRLGLDEELSRLAATLVHFTGYERPVATIRTRDALSRRLGQLLGTADILAQMSDRCYLEKCRDRLYPEFVLGRLAGRRRRFARALPEFASGEDLVHRTPAFYGGASERLNVQLARSYEAATHHFGGENPYLDAIEKNVRHAARIAHEPDPGRLLRRRSPSTLAPEARPWPKDLIGL